ncbi:MAG: hypothetical protein EXR77_09920 [Myxococcales bacterium]|nr:hypothetical protein [Myxococcales bacterium]
MPATRVIKRYANRKMYDSARSCYVTLEEIAEMVRNGEDIAVIDNRSKADVTEVTLTQALLDAERRRRGSVPLPGLRELLAQGGDFLQKRVADPVVRVREEAQRSVATWRGQAERILHRKAALDPDVDVVAVQSATAVAENPDPAHAKKLGWSVHGPWRLEDWQAFVDERLSHALLGLTAHAADSASHQAELVELRVQVKQLAARIEHLEAAIVAVQSHEP